MTFIINWCSFSVCYILNNSSKIFVLLAAAGEFIDMVEAGIVDPLKVIRIALVDAAR